MKTDWNKIIDDCNLFWQYPVITEQEFYNQNFHLDNVIGFPWATVLDKNINVNEVFEYLRNFIHPEREYITCCQHIRFRELAPLFQALNIKTLYTPHKCLGEDNLGSIQLKPAPLYAVNFEDEKRSLEFQNVDLLNCKRDLLYSFLGGLQPGYLTDIREKIFSLPKKENTLIVNTGGWHFNEMVYSNMQNANLDKLVTPSHEEKTKVYNKTLLRSRYSLCPSGTGPNSIRFWESLAVGSIPILLADTLELPYHPLWNEAIIHLGERLVGGVDFLLEEISPEEERRRRENCIKIYNDFRSNFTQQEVRPLIHYCCASYYTGNFGGVACYDNQLQEVFPYRVFFQGPQEKDQMIVFLNQCREAGRNPIVVTDNHLSCDVPLEYETFLVHHGSALTHAERNPDWDPFWKDLCCTGQKNMFSYRGVDNTKIISISTFCTDEFKRHFGKNYDNFNRIEILHSSEMREDVFKKVWNKTPVILGNWRSNSKGLDKIEKLSKSLGEEYQFKNLSVDMRDGIRKFIKDKQEEYINSDMFLQLSVSEGNSYATLDAMLCGLPIISSDVGLFYKDVPEECFTKINWEKIDDVEYLADKIRETWENRQILSENCRSWYLENYKFEYWKNKMTNIILGEDYDH
jgi:glycosyltransferase involved in cell wall biosynthesis